MVRIAFFGTPEFAVPTLVALIESPCEVVTVITQPDRPRGRGQRPSASPIKILALGNNIPVLTPEALNDPVFLNQMLTLQLELGVVVAYGKLVPDNLLEIPTHGFVNLHASLLPAYRGAAPIQRTVLDGNEVTGVTLIRMNSKLDSGPVLAQARVWPGTVMNSMLVWMGDTGGTGADAATHFLSNHGDVWNAWVDADIAASVEAAL